MIAELEAIALDAPLAGRLKPVEDTSFRELVGYVVYLEDAFSFLSRSPEELGLDVEGYPDAIAYCYVDDELGICFRCLCAAREGDGTLELLGAFDEVALTMRRATVADALCAPLDATLLAAFADAIAQLEEEYAADEFAQGMRELTDLDGLRNPEFPDVIKAVLATPNEDDGYELVWVKPWATSDNVPQCILMNEPSQESFGVHEGDALPLTFQRQPDGLIAIALAGGE